jgi:hypothetical protein
VADYRWSNTDRLPDLRTLGYALRLRWGWLHRTEPDSAWALLSSIAERKVRSMFSVSITIEVGDGSSMRFWTDAWLLDGVISTFAPNLFRAVGRRRLGRTVKDALSNRRWVCDITGGRAEAQTTISGTPVAGYRWSNTDNWRAR